MQLSVNLDQTHHHWYIEVLKIQVLMCCYADSSSLFQPAAAACVSFLIYVSLWMDVIPVIISYSDLLGCESSLLPVFVNSKNDVII